MDVTELISESGISLGTLTLATAIQAVVTLIVGLILIRVLLNLSDRAFDRSE